GKYFTPKHVEIHKQGIEPDVWYNFQNQLLDDSKLKGFEEQLQTKRDEMNKIRTDATRYLRGNDTVRDEAVKVATALSRGEIVPDRAEIKPPEDDNDPLGLAPDRDEPKESDTAPTVPEK
nr:hypothetical protein [bacterium]